MEIMIALFVLGMGMIMIAGSMPLAIRGTTDSVELGTATLVGRQGATQVTQRESDINFPIGDGEIHWYGPTEDQFLRSGAPNQRPLIRNDVAGWGVGVPYPGDERYAYHIFYRRRGTAAPFEWDVFIGVQVLRDGRFLPPADAANQAQLQYGDLYCDTTGIWRRWEREGFTPPGMGPFRWGVPGGVMVFPTTLRF